MTILMQLDKLQSRIARLEIGNGGVRKMTNTAIAKFIGTGGGLKKFLGVGLLRFSGFLVGEVFNFLLAGITINFTSLWGLIVREVGFLWTFDWNKPDEKIWEEIKSEKKAVAGIAAYGVGNALGYAVCGVLPSATIYRFNDALALHIFETLGETALFDVAANVAITIQMASQVAAHAAFAYAFVNVRSLLKPENNELLTKLTSRGKMSKEEIKKALEERDKPWTFAKKFNEKVETIENKTVQELVKQGVQGFTQSCIQSGYVVAGGLDSFLASAKKANNGILGAEETVEILLKKKKVTLNH